MTREEAIKVLNNFPIDFRNSGGFEAMEALKIAISALRPVSRERVEKVWRGEWEPGNPICPICGKDKFDGLDADIWADWMPNFCPHCGAPMTDEAVEMVMERWKEALPPPNEPLTCGLVDRHGMPLRAGDTVAADKFFVYAVRYGSHNVNPDNCAPAYQVGWYLEIMWAYPGFEDSVGHTEPLYDIDGTAARYPAHCADTADGLYNLKLEVCCRPPEGEEDT